MAIRSNWTNGEQWNASDQNELNAAVLAAATTSSNVASATKLQTARTINGIAFDGTQNITVADQLLVLTSNTTLPSDKNYIVIAAASDPTAVALMNFDSSFPAAGMSSPQLFYEEAKSALWEGNITYSTAQKKFGAGAASFSGATSGSTLKPQSMGPMNIGTSDFCVEVWIFPTGYAVADPIVFDYGTNGSNKPRVYITNTGGIRFARGTTDHITGSGVVLNQWQHVALARVSGVTRLFLNGTQVGSSYTDTNNYNTNYGYQTPFFGAVAVEWQLVTSRPFQGFMDGIRITANNGRYSSNFTPPTSAFTYEAAKTLTLPGVSGKSGLRYTIKSTLSSSVNVLAASPGHLYPDDLLNQSNFANAIDSSGRIQSDAAYSGLAGFRIQAPQSYTTIPGSFGVSGRGIQIITDGTYWYIV